MSSRIRVHPIVENFVIEAKERNTVGQVVDVYANELERSFQRNVRGSVRSVTPYLRADVTACDDNTVINDVLRGKEGLFLLNVTEEHPMYHIRSDFDQLAKEYSNLQQRMTDLQATVTEKKKKKNKKKKKGSKNVAIEAPVTEDTGAASSDEDDIGHSDTRAVASSMPSNVDFQAVVAQLRREMQVTQEKLEKEIQSGRNKQEKLEKEIQAERDERKRERQVAQDKQEKLEQQLQTERAEREKAQSDLAKKGEMLQKRLVAEKRELQAQVDDMADRTGNLEAWSITQDISYLDQIRLRSLLDQAQAGLAVICVFGTYDEDSITALSMKWRVALDSGNEHSTVSDNDRLITARTLLNPYRHLAYVETLINNNIAMHLLVQRFSSIRTKGNNVAHQVVPTSLLKKVVERSLKGNEKTGMMVVVDFIDSLRNNSH